MYHNFRKALFTAAALTALFGFSVPAQAQQFLDVTSLVTGTSGSFTGTLNGVTVNGTITANDGSFQFFGPSGFFNGSTMDNSSPQFSDSSIYSPSTPLTDRIGYQKTPSNGIATVTLVFSQAEVNPVFQVANLDGMKYDFSPTAGLGGLVLLSGNGGNGDGLGVVGNTIVDLNPFTLAGVDPGDPIPTTGPRSAYGSVQLLGTFTSLTFNAVTNGSGDSGSFTLSVAPNAAAVPEPGFVQLGSLATMGMVGFGLLRRRRKAA